MASGLLCDCAQLGISLHDTGQAPSDGVWFDRYHRPGGSPVKAALLSPAYACGKDPLIERRAASSAYALVEAKRITFDQCAAAYIEAHCGTWKNPKHVAQWENTIATYASPLIGALAVADVETDLVVKVLNPSWRSKTETAVRLRGQIECILDWAAARKFRQGENPARWRGHLENLLANPNKLAPVKNHPALPWRGIGSFVEDLRAREGVAARAVEFALLTACRSGEVRGATWEELDMEAKLMSMQKAKRQMPVH